MDEAPIFAPSLPVPNVQEMVKMNPFQVPIRYMRNQEEMEKVKYKPHLSSEIPVIDLTLVSNGNIEEMQKLDLACKEWGFFQVISNIGVSYRANNHRVLLDISNIFLCR